MSRQQTVDGMLSELEMFGVKLGLETTASVLAAEGDPHRRFSSVLVAGTNGKGSVAAMLATIGTAAGYRTGLFTSPHLESVTERVTVDGRPIDTGHLGNLLQRVRLVSERVTGSPATYFESIFIAACLWFAQQEVDLAVLEVGLGGRLDATNVCDPVLSVITGISLEHQEQLGSTLSAIATEKAGIMRHARPTVIGRQPQEAGRQLRRCAREKGAAGYLVPEAARVVVSREEPDWSRRVTVRSTAGEYSCHLRLPGRHQEDNLLTAIVAAELLAGAGWPEIDEAAVEAGIEQCRWPGRLERIEIEGRPSVVLDAAHNPAAARALAEFIAPRLESYCLLFGVLDGKEVDHMLPVLAESASTVVLTRPPSARGLDPAALEHLAGGTQVVVIDEPRRALDHALESAAPIVVCGSIYLVGEIRGLLRRRFGLPLA